jgi:hypothetical protein
MSDVTAVVAEPSSAPVVAEVQTTEPVVEKDGSQVLAEMTGQQRQEWRQTGKLPAPPESQDSAPATSKEAQPAKDAPESGTGKEAQEKSGHKPKLSAKERIDQLKSTISKIAKEAGIDEEAAPSPAAPKVEAKTETKPEVKDEVKAEEFKPLDEETWYKEHPDATLQDWIRASVAHETKWNVAQELKAAKEAETKAAQEAEQKKQASEWMDNWKKVSDEAAKDIPDFKELTSKSIPIEQNGTVDIFIGQSKVGPRVYYALAKDPAKLEAIKAMTPMYQAHALVELEKSLTAKPVAQEKPKEKKAPAEPITEAPEPESQVGGRGTAAQDEALSAAREGDYRSYAEEQNSRDRARFAKK